MIILRKKIIPATLLIIILALYLSGCGKPDNNDYKLADALEYHPYQLYLQQEPYSKIYVEVDSLEDTEVPELYLKTISDFLGQHCEKETITIVKDDPIRLKPNQKDMPVELISLLYTDGPRATEGDCAYIHCFFYDRQKDIKANIKNPYVYGNTATTAFFNTSYVKHNKVAQLHFIRHELGHILGLATNTEHGDGSHCNNNCLMKASVDVYLTPIYKLFGRSNKGLGLCDDCLNDIKTAKTEQQNSKMRFEGPFLVRKEQGYEIIAMPYLYIISPEINNKSHFDWKNTVEKIQKEFNFLPEEVRPKDKMKTIFATHTDSDNNDYELSEDMELLLLLKSDPVGSIKEYAERYVKKYNTDKEEEKID